MFRRKTRSKHSFLNLPPSNRGSDITRPESSSLMVNPSDTEAEYLPKELTSIFSDNEDDLGNTSRKSSSLMKSLSQKKQSTPLIQSHRGEGENISKQNSKLRSCQSICESTDSQKKISFFEEVLKAAGASPLPGNSSYLMSEDQAVFSIKVKKKLSENPENVHKFINSLREKVKDCENLQKMLAHTLTANDCEVARGPVQEPLMRMLLNVDCIKENVVELLLDTMVDFIMDNKAESEKVQLVSSILRQMRFLIEKKDMNFASRLFEIIHMAKVKVKREIIFFLPEIIPQEELEETCYQLLELLKFDEMLTQVIIDAMSNLPLNKALRSQVCTKVSNRLDKCPMEFLPSLVQLILNKSDTEEPTEVINGLRKNLPFTPQHSQMKDDRIRNGKEKSEDSSYVKVTFDNLKFSLMGLKQMADSWIKIISNLNSPTDFRCVDWVMLVIFYSCLFGKKNQILHIIRNKIRSSVLTKIHVQDMFKMLLIIAEEYYSALLDLASALLKSFEPKLSDFGASLYKECYSHFHFYLKQIVISEIILHVGTGLPASVDTALCIIRELCTYEKESLSQHTSCMMELLMKVRDLDLTQVRILMDVMAELVFFEREGSAVQDELQIFIRKQLMSSNSEQYKKGILAAIMFGKHSVGKEGDCKDADLTEVNSLLEVAMGSNWMSETKRGFFNDEFATMLQESNLSQSFLQAWKKKTCSLVKENLIVKDIDVECSDFPMSLQYSLHEEGFKKLVFPAVEFIIGSNDERSLCAIIDLNVPVPVIPSTLRLLWCLEENPNRAFYASVIMPEPTVYDTFTNLEDSQKKKILDCLFLCSNYLIECINAFCSHGILTEAVLRVKQLIQVRKLIARHLNLMNEFIPPVCQFYAPAQKIVAKRKPSENATTKGRKRKLEEAETSNYLSAESQQTAGRPAVCSEEDFLASRYSSHEADLQSYCRYFRELDFQVYKLLALDFNSGTLTTKKSTCDSPVLETRDILFLLEDFIWKCEQLLKSPDVMSPLKSKPAASLIQNVTPETFIKATIEILPGLLDKIEVFSKYCESLLESNDRIYSSRGLHSQDACYVKLAMAAGLELIAEIICWPGFQSSNGALLRDTMSILSKKGSPSDAHTSLGTLAALAGKYLAKFSETVLTLSGGLSIIKSFRACLRYSSETGSALAYLCKEFLCREWFTVTGARERGSAYNQHVDFLLKTYFSSVDDKVEVVRATAKIVLLEVGELKKEDSALKTFKTINKGNFPLLYRTLCEALATASMNELSDVDGDDRKCLVTWSKIVEALMTLVETAKIHSSRVILASLLKRSQSIIQLFLSKGMAVVQSALKVKSEEVLTLLKYFQFVTRFLHSICCHSRVTNDSLVAAHVPAIRSLCERLTLEVKARLILNGIPTDCITIAVLKNKDIKGNDIISQETLEGDSDDDSELPPEDTPDVEEDVEPHSDAY